MAVKSFNTSLHSQQPSLQLHQAVTVFTANKTRPLIQINEERARTSLSNFGDFAP